MAKLKVKMLTAEQRKTRHIRRQSREALAEWLAERVVMRMFGNTDHIADSCPPILVQVKPEPKPKKRHWLLNFFW